MFNPAAIELQHMVRANHKTWKLDCKAQSTKKFMSWFVFQTGQAIIYLHTAVYRGDQILRWTMNSLLNPQ